MVTLIGFSLVSRTNCPYVSYVQQNMIVVTRQGIDVKSVSSPAVAHGCPPAARRKEER